MAFLASHDPLTGLPNRHEFEARFEAVLADTRASTRHALCYLDLDDFKIVNDTSGHVAGDELLRQLAQVVSSTLRHGDFVARLGGDEFGLLFMDCDLATARSLGERLLDAIRQFRFHWQDRQFRLGASLGVVPVTHSSAGTAELLSAADSACYVAKERGRNQLHVSAPDDAGIAARHDETRWIQRVTRAFEERRICLYQQPIYPLRDDAGLSLVEVLLRLLDEAGQLILPTQFLSTTERHRMMPSIDRWVLELALGHLGRHASGDERQRYAINLSGQSLGAPDFLDFALRAIDASGVSPRRLCFEITETAAITSYTFARRFMAALRDRGCRFILDDFGVGFSSFSQLGALPVEFLKIDGSLIRGVDDDPVQREIVNAIHRIGKAMSVDTIAECVESEAEFDVVRDIGVDYAQGFWLARPAPMVGDG
jgi:diguanylate cyclase (GGDEF)-like protein